MFGIKNWLDFSKEENSASNKVDNSFFNEHKELNQKNEIDRQQEKTKENNDSNFEMVVDLAKIQCTLCTNPIGILKLFDAKPTMQNQIVATVSDNQKRNFMFTGTCMKSPNAAVPCVSLIIPAQWKDFGNIQFQDEYVLLKKSTIQCMFGGTEIKIINTGQISIPSFSKAQSLPIP